MLIMKQKVKSLLTLLLFGTLLFIPNEVNASHQEYEQLSCSDNRAVDIVFVMDDSGSISSNDPNDIRIEATKNLVDALQTYDRTSLIKFNLQAENLLSLTNNRHEIHHALDVLGQIGPGGGTDLSEGMAAALTEFTASSGSNHKIMIILSDGVSINNQLSTEHAQTAYEEDITIYTIGLGAKTAIDEPLLQNIASMTSGSYFHAANATHLTEVLNQIHQSIEDNREPKVYSDWTLTNDVYESGDLVLHENMKLNLNGYNLEVEGDLVLLSCAEVRAVSGTITAGNVEQNAGSILNLNNSQLNVKDTFTQDGYVRVNGEYTRTSEHEINVEGTYNQQVRGYLDLNGNALKVNQNFTQDGHIYVGGVKIHALKDVTQKGHVNLQAGTLKVGGNLHIAGGPLIDDQFKKNKSLNINNGLLQVGSKASMEKTSKYGNVYQTSGQLYVNHGTVRIYGDYSISDGWLTMTEGSMDTTSSDYGEGDGDFVHVYRHFSMESKRNHAKRAYTHLGKPSNDQGHLTEGVLRVDGDFRQRGDKQFHASYSDRSQNYQQDYSRYNFVAEGRHKVLLTGKGDIDVGSSRFQFNILELKDRLGDYTRTGQVKWNTLIENDKSANATLQSLTINDIPVQNFHPNTLNYTNHVVPEKTVQGPLKTLKVDARAADHRNATVTISGNHIGVDGTTQVQVLVTAADGTTEKIYTIGVRVGSSNPNTVTAIELDRSTQVFMQNSSTSFTPAQITIGYTIYPKTATNQQVEWTSTDPSVATVNHHGVVTPINAGKTSIIAKTVDGGFMKSVAVEVKQPHELLTGIKTLADLVSDNDRYDKIMSLYDPTTIGIVVPGDYIKSVNFNSTSPFAIGTIATDATVDRVDVRINDHTLSAPRVGTDNMYRFSRAGVSPGAYIEIIAYNQPGDELERVSTSYPVDYTPHPSLPGYYSIDRLMQNPILFNLILDNYSLDELKFTF